MVKIIDFKEMENEAGEKFCTLILQGGVEMVKSKSTGKFYATARTSSVISTFDAHTCNQLIGEQMPGNIKKVDCEEYDYTVKESGEVIKLTHRYEYVPEEVNQSASLRTRVHGAAMRTVQNIH